MSRHSTTQKLQIVDDAISESKSSDAGSDAPSHGIDGHKRHFRPRSSSNSAVERVRLPPIKERGIFALFISYCVYFIIDIIFTSCNLIGKDLSSSQHNLTGGKSEAEGSKLKSSYFQTGAKTQQQAGKVYR